MNKYIHTISQLFNKIMMLFKIKKYQFDITYKASEKIVDFIKQKEGLRLQAYQPIINKKTKKTDGVWTIGYGHTKNVLFDDEIDEKQADIFLLDDILQVEKALINIQIKYEFKFNQNQFDAMCSFCFNVGTTFHPDMIQRFKDKDLDEVGNALLLYIYSKGRVVSGLKKRRKEEYMIYFDK